MVYYYTNKKIRVVLKQLRLKKKLSQQQVADKLGVTKAYISQVELGKTAIPRYRALIKFLELYGVKPKYFEELMKEAKVE